MAIIDAYKMDGLGNAFLIIDRRKNKINLEKKKIIQLARNDQINFDQLIYIDNKLKDEYPVEFFNSDGNEIDACGNGSRCIAYLLGKENNIVDVHIKTKERVLKAKILDQSNVLINMGTPSFDWKKIPLSKNIDPQNISIEIDGQMFNNGFALNVGNPHIIFFVEDCFKININQVGSKIENHNLFPEKCNVTFAQIVNKNNITVNVWERGAGLTKACGTAACATAVASYTKGMAENKVNIRFKEGVLNINFNENKEILMTGKVSEVQKIKVEL